MTARPEPAASVIVPTHGRADTIIRCLRGLEAQSTRAFEVIVVNDGSPDTTHALLSDYLTTTPLAVRYVIKENGGAASARNAALREAGAPVVIMIGDDILAEPGLVARHIAFHEEHPAPNQAAVGLTRWNPSRQVTPLMRWLEEEGIQFGYAWIEDGEVVDYRYFYASNVSVKSVLLEGMAFDEDFTGAGLEDTELGYRLQTERGLELTYVAGALAYHEHDTDFLRSCHRQRDIGSYAATLLVKWPELGALFGSREQSAGTVERLELRLLRSRCLLRALTAYCQWLSVRKVRRQLFSRVLRAYYEQGLREPTR